MSRVPLIDVSRFTRGSELEKDAVAREVDKACRDVGFLLVTGHDVSQEARGQFEDAMMDFFALPAETKMRSVFTAESPRGYRRAGVVALAKSRGEDTPPDLMERFSIGQFDLPDDEYYTSRRKTFFQENQWPESVPSLEAAAKRYYRAMERLASNLMSLFARALDLPERYFENFFDKHISVLVTNYYPPQLRPPIPGQLRAGAHTDYGSLTILAPSRSPGGLQVYTRDEVWEEVPQFPGSFVINLGDFMARWTNDRWISTLHRVVNPTGETAHDPRMSVVFFQQPNDDAMISCIGTCMDGAHPAKYEAVIAGEWMAAKMKKTYTGQLQAPRTQA